MKIIRRNVPFGSQREYILFKSKTLSELLVTCMYRRVIKNVYAKYSKTVLQYLIKN